MGIGPGSRIGPYEVTALIGEGGMGKVWRAHHSGLKRDDALKVLPDAFVSDPERLARFRREAQVLASLNHPNIAHVYGLEQADGVQALVMELVEGPTLADRIAQGPIPVDEALPIAKQIAQALETAHEQGIIHRDLKPANIKVRPDGTVKVLDFGLAKALEPTGARVDATASPTITSPAMMTGVGMLLGTAAYMSPEQARGRAVDKRADIWAFGCVLYELLTGKQVFTGETVTEIIASVLKSEPDWNALPESTPPGIRSLLRRCLRKDIQHRSKDAGDLRIEIDETQAAPDTRTATKSTPPISLWRRALPFVLTALAAAAIAVGVSLWNRPETLAPQPVSRFVVPLPPEDRIAEGPFVSVAISPNGSHVAYAGVGAGGQLYLRSLDSSDVRPIPGTQGGGHSPFFSPDGQWIGFQVSGKLMKVALNGGPALTLCGPCGEFILGPTWGPDDTIVFAALRVEGGFGLFQVSAAGGTPTVLAMPDSAKSELWPEFLPDGKTLLFTAVTDNSSDNWQIAALNLLTGERGVVIQSGSYPRYASTGHLLYYRAGTVMAVPFDPERLEVAGAPAPVLEGVMTSPTTINSPTGNGVAQFALSRTGSLVYVAGLREAERTLVWVDREGAIQPLGAPPRAYARPALSPDGNQVAVNIEGQTSDIWIYDVPRGTLTRLTFEGNNNRPVWTPDGKRIAFPSQRGGLRGLFWKLADGSGPEETLTDDKLFVGVNSISPDGKLASGTVNRTGESDIGIFELQGGRKTTVFLKTPFDDNSPELSPDGRWIAYSSDESGRSEIYVRPFPGPGGKWQISTEGGVAPVWARNGRELFYASRPTGKLMAVDVTTLPTFQAGSPRVIREEGFRWTVGAAGGNYDVSLDGQRFLAVQGSDANLTQLNVVLNWFEELKRLGP